MTETAAVFLLVFAGLASAASLVLLGWANHLMNSAQRYLTATRKMLDHNAASLNDTERLNADVRALHSRAVEFLRRSQDDVDRADWWKGTPE